MYPYEVTFKYPKGLHPALSYEIVNLLTTGWGHVTCSEAGDIPENEPKDQFPVILETIGINDQATYDTFIADSEHPLNPYIVS